jgi:predicted DNA-binding protein with PD1-like motif
METVAKKENLFIVRLERGEELIKELTRFAISERIKGAWFLAFGGAEDIEISYYDLKKKKYVTRRFRGTFEILNIIGNIALLRKTHKSQYYHTLEYDSKGMQRVMIHAHGTFGKTNYSTIGGHIVRCIIGGTCEVYLEKLSSLRRKPDPKTGLNLFY